MKFTYGTGQKPLEGYTIKRGVGKGGFGEVYFAVSDGGKEVALKLLRGDSGVELRGIAHCINLKHQNLVSVYDLKTDPQGNQWVVMEYVSGEPLHQVLERHPNGLPLDLAREWFLALARAVGYLHDHGIVHRDLKPANIFLEDGLIKVGDYGLCKSISASQRTPQTQSVGTVHYMAPEISTGNYNKQIDMYACGVLLYEMLTGKLPFEGESPGEVLMKHLTSAPDLSLLPIEYRSIVAKALAKDPGQRYTSMAEFANTVETMAKPSPSPVIPPPLPKAVGPAPAARTVPVSSSTIPEVLPVVHSTRGSIGELTGSMAMIAVLGLLTTMLWAAISKEDWHWLGTTYFLTVAVSWTVLLPAKLWNQHNRENIWSRRLTMAVFGALIGVFALWLDGWNLNPKTFGIASRASSDDSIKVLSSPREALAIAAAYMSYFALVLGLMKWWRLADRRRKSWFSVWPVLVSGFLSSILLQMLEIERHHELSGYGAAAALTTAAALVQFVSPHDPRPMAFPKRLRYKTA
jgi:hypothetical protein